MNDPWCPVHGHGPCVGGPDPCANQQRPDPLPMGVQQAEREHVAVPEQVLDELLTELHSARIFQAIDMCGSIDKDTRNVDEEIERRASQLGITWSGCDCLGTYYHVATTDENEEAMRRADGEE